jgi:hypothetical protein
MRNDHSVRKACHGSIILEVGTDGDILLTDCVTMNSSINRFKTAVSTLTFHHWAQESFPTGLEMKREGSMHLVSRSFLLKDWSTVNRSSQD